MRRLIILEGQDGVGKDTVAKELARISSPLAAIKNFPDYLEPLTGPAIKAHLRGEGTLDAAAFQALQTTNKILATHGLLRTTTPRILIFVRWWPSGVVYGQLDELSIGQANSWTAGGATLDLIVHSAGYVPTFVLLDAPAEVALARQRARAQEPERYEGDFLRQNAIAEGYREMWAERPKWVVVDACNPPETIALEIVRRATANEVLR